VTQTMHDEHHRLLRRAELIKRLWRLLQETDSGDPTHSCTWIWITSRPSMTRRACGRRSRDTPDRFALQGGGARRDTLARLGGDEFGLLRSTVRQNSARTCAATASGRGILCLELEWRNVSDGRQQLARHLQTHNHSLNSILASADRLAIRPAQFWRRAAHPGSSPRLSLCCVCRGRI